LRAYQYSATEQPYLRYLPIIDRSFSLSEETGHKEFNEGYRPTIQPVCLCVCVLIRKHAIWSKLAIRRRLENYNSLNDLQMTHEKLLLL